MRKPLVAAVSLNLLAAAALAAPPGVADLLRMVPPTAQFVVGLDAAALRAHPAVQKLLLEHASRAHLDADAAAFLAEAGLDPLRDVNAMVAAVIPDGATSHGAAAFAGRFDPEAMGAALTKRGATPTTLGAVPGFRLPEGERHHGAAAVLAQVSREVVVVGNEAAVAAMLAPRHEASPLVDKAVAAGQIDPRAPFWAVGTIPAFAHRHAATMDRRAEDEADHPLHHVLAAAGVVKSVALQASLDDSLHISGVASADTAENAELLRDAAKGALAALRLGAQDEHPELVDVLRGVQVRASGTDVAVSGAIPVALLEKLAAEHSGGGPKRSAT
ncbi:MAG TPA: hypothetical protein VLW17_07975 [Thermoanaerobaculaceae bacterium]|nr:hypothetical protein [Thermoanaerobaculaceae bacterium]